MGSSYENDFKEYFERIRKKKTRNKIICFDSVKSSLSEVKLIMNFLGLSTSGTWETLISRLTIEGFRTGDEFIFDSEKFSDKLGQGNCPTFTVRAFLGSKGECSLEDIKDFERRIQKYIPEYTEKKIMEFDFLKRIHLRKREQSKEEDEIANVIDICLRNNGKIKDPTKSQIDTFLKYGYRYLKTLKIFIHSATQEKISGEKLAMGEYILHEIEGTFG